jgi:hypothetical protein
MQLLFPPEYCGDLLSVVGVRKTVGMLVTLVFSVHRDNPQITPSSGALFLPPNKQTNKQKRVM